MAWTGENRWRSFTPPKIGAGGDNRQPLRGSGLAARSGRRMGSREGAETRRRSRSGGGVGRPHERLPVAGSLGPDRHSVRRMQDRLILRSSLPRRRETINASVAYPAETSALMDSRLRGNDGNSWLSLHPDQPPDPTPSTRTKRHPSEGWDLPMTARSRSRGIPQPSPGRRSARMNQMRKPVGGGGGRRTQRLRVSA